MHILVTTVYSFSVPVLDAIKWQGWYWHPNQCLSSPFLHSSLFPPSILCTNCVSGVPHSTYFSRYPIWSIFVSGLLLKVENRRYDQNERTPFCFHTQSLFRYPNAVMWCPLAPCGSLQFICNNHFLLKIRTRSICWRRLHMAHVQHQIFE